MRQKKNRKKAQSINSIHRRKFIHIGAYVWCALLSLLLTAIFVEDINFSITLNDVDEIRENGLSCAPQCYAMLCTEHAIWLYYVCICMYAQHIAVERNVRSYSYIEVCMAFIMDFDIVWSRAYLCEKFQTPKIGSDWYGVWSMFQPKCWIHTILKTPKWRISTMRLWCLTFSSTYSVWGRKFK